MSSLAGAVFLVVAAVWLAFALKIPSHLNRVLVVTREAMARLRDSELSDDEKEALMQTQSLRLFGLFFLIIGTFAVAFAAPTAVLWLLDVLRVLSLERVLQMAVSLKFLLGCTVVGVAAAFLFRTRRKA